MKQLLPTKKHQNRCSSYAGGLFGHVNYEPTEFAELFSVLYHNFLMAQMNNFFHQPQPSEPLQNIKGPFCDLEALS